MTVAYFKVSGTEYNSVCTRPLKEVSIIFIQFSSVAQLCPTLGHPMNCSMPGFPVHHHSWNLLKLMSIESVMPSNNFILCCPLFLLPSIFSQIRIFSNESTLCMRWPKYLDYNIYLSLSDSLHSV